ncbi:MAG: helix-turn-helix transcriptional regulator [Actinobacteria bacterium]|nr:helix-turn-helix transcriptional regulator [Actinomycetota bacterium]
MPRSYSPVTREAIRLLGGQVALARRERRMGVRELAERAGTSPPTVRKIERGDPQVTIGIAFEVAAVVGVVLFDPDPDARAAEARRVDDHLALLPRRVRARRVDDDF